MYLVKQINNGAIFFLSLSPIRWKNEFKKMYTFPVLVKQWHESQMTMSVHFTDVVRLLTELLMIWWCYLSCISWKNMILILWNRKSHTDQTISLHRGLSETETLCCRTRELVLIGVSGVFRNAFLSTGFEYRDKEKNR